jgi:hypothetical protein
MSKQTKTVTLTKAHRHAGVDYKKGDKLEVDARGEAKLQRAGVIGKAAEPAKAGDKA